MGTPTAKDVAKQAGVSIATVSRVVNNVGSVSPRVTKRVKHAVDALGYQPSRTAQRLRAKRSRVIGLIISDIQNPFFTSVVRGIEDQAYDHGYSLVLCNSDEDPEKERLYVDVMGAEVAGVILATMTEDNPRVHSLIDRGIPVVALDRRIKNKTIDSVLVDNIEGAVAAVSHLIELGHRRIGFISGPLTTTTFEERRDGYLRALREHGIPIRRTLMCFGDSKQTGGYACAKALLGLNPPLTALFAASNLATLGALHAIRERGLKIPDDISIISFDDMSFAPLMQPPLTVVVQPTYELGQKAAQLLLERLDQPDKPVARLRLETKLIMRQSTGAPADSRTR